MYVTRPISLYRRDPSALSIPPLEGPHSGYLLFEDEEEEDRRAKSSCWGTSKDTNYRTLPFPQDKLLKVMYTTTSTSSNDSNTTTYVDKTFFIPVLGQPLSSNLYYVVKTQGKHKGLVHTCSKEEDMTMFCLCRCVEDVKPMPFNPGNVYQRMKIIDRGGSGFKAESAAADGFPPAFLRRKGWNVYTSDLPENMILTSVEGLNVHLRSRTPDFDFPLWQKSSSIATVGEWYIPFMFIKEIGGLESLQNQVKESLFYKMSLEQQWVEIFSVDNCDRGTITVLATTIIREDVSLGGGEYVVKESNIEDGMFVFKEKNEVGGEFAVWMSLVIFEKMRNEQGIGEQELSVTVEKVFECENNTWIKFGCYILEERYVLKRMNGNVVLTYTFRDPNQMKPKWEFPLQI